MTYTGPNAQGSIEALTALIAGDTDHAVAMFTTCTQVQAFGWACGYAKGIGSFLPRDRGRTIVDIDRIDGVPVDDEIAELGDIAGPFIAATCNDDIGGALLLWYRQTYLDRARLLFFIAKLCALTIEAQAAAQ